MRPIKLKKISDENNSLGFDEIELIDREIAYTYSYEIDGQQRIGYHYMFLAIADGILTRIDDVEWENFDAYQIETK